MIARLQRVLVMLILLGTLAWWLWASARGWPLIWVLAGALLCLLPHAPVLALEFVLLRCQPQAPGLPRLTPLRLLRAWAGEVLAGLRVFGWQQPFAAGYRTRQAAEAARGRRGLLLVHGYCCNRGLWRRWMRRLDDAGVPWEAVTLEPAFGSIDAAVPELAAAARALQQRTGLAPVVVAHSMGGLVLRAWLADLPPDQADAAVHRVITIGTPHQGTWLARFAATPNARQMRQHSRWLAGLRQRERHGWLAQRLLCFYGHADNIVFPAATACLPDAACRHLPGVAHVAMVEQAEVWDAALAALQAPALPPHGPA
ncbi:MAG: permease [Burkholderiaceae bacterium]|nr:permease [Burkholderiaceae bacterium]